MATIPWMWNRGIAARLRSSGPSSKTSATDRAEAKRLAWLSGTTFCCEVVPDVWSSRARSVVAGRGKDSPATEAMRSEFSGKTGSPSSDAASSIANGG